MWSHLLLEHICGYVLSFLCVVRLTKTKSMVFEHFEQANILLQWWAVVQVSKKNYWSFNPLLLVIVSATTSFSCFASIHRNESYIWYFYKETPQILTLGLKLVRISQNIHSNDSRRLVWGAASKVHDFDWRKMARRSKLAIVWLKIMNTNLLPRPLSLSCSHLYAFLFWFWVIVCCLLLLQKVNC